MINHLKAMAHGTLWAARERLDAVGDTALTYPIFNPGGFSVGKYDMMIVLDDDRSIVLNAVDTATGETLTLIERELV